MANEKTTIDSDADQSQSTLKKALIIFAIIEALVLIPLMIYLVVR